MNPSAPIRLFADAHVFDGGYQGTRSFLQGLYTELAQRPEVEVYLGAADPEKLREAFAPVADRIRFLPYRSAARYRRLLWEIPKLLKANGIDYAHFQYAAPPLRVCPYIVTTHDLLFEEQPAHFPRPYRLLRRHWFRRSVAQATIRTTVSAYAAGSIGRQYGIDPGSLALLPNAVTPFASDAATRAAARARLQAAYGVGRYLLCVSRLEPRKNQQLLLRAFDRLQLAEQGYHLVLIGNRSLAVPAFDAARAAMSARAQQALLLLENRPEAELRDWYRGTELFLYPSLGEGFGIPPLEAAMAGVPVLCSNRTALADFDFFGTDLHDPADEEGWMNRMEQLLCGGTDAATLQQRSAAVQQRYSWKQSADKLLGQIAAHRLQTGAL